MPRRTFLKRHGMTACCMKGGNTVSGGVRFFGQMPARGRTRLGIGRKPPWP
ncbi:twin-arginine translocation signal domain-containing protein [Desulfolutivibrio sp.]|uniref:twin-arginine translocation signal domain-containing protein n=1 Tax=Desulfolutivibrio sp. TaxID=2773296 RepID=UPI003FA44EED